MSPEGGSLINIPYQTPDEYRLRLRVMKGSEQMVGIGLVTGRSRHLITIDSYPTQGCLSKFDVVDGKGIVFHQGKRALPLNEVSTVICTVRAGGSIVVECNGRELGRWEGDSRRLAIRPRMDLRPEGRPFRSFGRQGERGPGIDLLPLPECRYEAGHG